MASRHGLLLDDGCWGSVDDGSLLGPQVIGPSDYLQGLQSSRAWPDDDDEDECQLRAYGTGTGTGTEIAPVLVLVLYARVSRRFTHHLLMSGATSLHSGSQGEVRTDWS